MPPAAAVSLVPEARRSSTSSLTIARLLERRGLVIAAVWLVPALLAASETYLFWRIGGRDYPFWRAILMEGPAWAVYALLTPVVFALGRLLPPQRPHLARNVAAHLAMSLSAGLVYAAVATTTTQLFSPAPRTMSYGRMVLAWYLSALPLTTLTYFGTLGVGLALGYFAEARRRENEASRLSAQLAEARLGALRMQLHPHFLFNSLNAVTVLARDGDTAGVARMLTLLSDLLRDVLRTEATHLITLDDELAFARRYLDIERVRFDDRLQVREVVADEVRSALVPPFVLQPLIENAVRHGIAPRAAGGTVEIGARLGGDGTIELWVSDDGVGLPADWSGSDDYGIGLSNCDARLAALPGGGGLTVSRAPERGTRCVARLPARWSQS